LHVWTHVGFVSASSEGLAILKQVIVEAGGELVNVNIAASAGICDIFGLGCESEEVGSMKG